jgi:hypothetical protein
VTAVPTCNAVALAIQEFTSGGSWTTGFPSWLYGGVNVAVVLSALAAKICAQLLVNRDFARWYAGGE